MRRRESAGRHKPLGRREPVGGCRPRREPLGRRRADESGGAVSLWVVLMVPVSAFAAVVAMAGPQRMAAESSMDEAADDLATMAVAWRDGHGADEGPLPAFPPDCQRSDEQSLQLADLLQAEDQARVDRDAKRDARNDARDAIPFVQAALDNAEAALTAAEGVRRDAQDAHNEYEARLKEWEEDYCREMFNWIVRDLGYLGVDVNSLQGFYSDSLTKAPSPNSSAPADQMALPCRISPKVVVLDAVHVSLVADWIYAGWAAAQVWPDGTRMGAESIGRMRRSVDDSTLLEECEQNLDVLDSQGRAVVLGKSAPDSERSRKLTQSVPGRTTIGG